MTENEEFYAPRNLQNSLLSNLGINQLIVDLPNESVISFKKNDRNTQESFNYEKESVDKDNKYIDKDLEEDTDIRITIADLNSSIQSKLFKPQKQQISIGQSYPHKAVIDCRPSQQPNRQVVSRLNRKSHKKKTKEQQKTLQRKEVNIENEIGQVAEWEYKGTGEKNDSEDNSEEEEDEKYNFEDSQQAIQIKKRIQSKLKALDNKGSNNRSPAGPGSLKAKAQQLRRKNQQSEKDKEIVSKKIEPKHSQIREVKQQQQQQSDVDDHWDKINSKTITEQKTTVNHSKKLNHQQVMKYYISLQLDNESKQVDIEDQSGNQPEESTGCLGLFGCLREPTNQSQRRIVEKQALCLSKVQLENNEESIYILKHIWNTLTNDKFSRYGNHWNKLGFQGRDPATDLRSTGILSIIQWYNFIHQHKEYSQKIYNFAVEMEFPLALTAIKITSVFILFLRNYKIRGERWEDLQQVYNALHFTYFSKVMKIQISVESIGDTVQKNIEVLKKNLVKARKDYSQWKKTGISTIE